MKLLMSFKRWSVWRLIALLAVGVTLIAGCGTDTAGVGTGGTGEITAVTAKGVKSVYLAKIDTTSTATPSGIDTSSSAGSLVETLAYLTSTGKNAPVVFQTSSGKKVILEVTSLKGVKEGFIAISFDAIIEAKEVGTDSTGKSLTFISRRNVSGKALVDMNSTKVYNLSDYDIDNVLVDKDNIYITKSSFKDGIRGKELYKIPFNDLSHAIPLNNGNYTPAGNLRFIINNRIIGSDHSFDINGVSLPKPLTWVLLSPTQSTMTGAGEPFSAAVGFGGPYIVDNAGNIWGYRSDQNGKFGKFRLSLDDNGNTVVSDYEEFTLGVPVNTMGMYVINGSGNHVDHLYVGDQWYLYVKRNVDSGIRFETGALNFGDSTSGGRSYSTYYNGAIYWLSNSTIYSMDLALNQVSALYQIPNLVNPVTIANESTNWVIKDITMTRSNDTLFFYQYLTPTTIGTYALTIGNATPVLLSQSAANIDQVVELTF